MMETQDNKEQSRNIVGVTFDNAHVALSPGQELMMTLGYSLKSND